MSRLPTSTPSDRIVWLVTIHAHGDPIRIATADVDVSDAATGQTWHYAGDVASLDVSEAGGAAGEDAAGVSVPVEALLTTSQAARIALRVVEVAQWVEGTDYAQRRVIVTGQVVNPEWGREGEPCSFSAESRLWTDPVLIPSATALVDGTTWAHAETAHPGVLGSIYPTIIGRPGVVSTTWSSTGRITGSEGLVVWDDPSDHTTIISGVGLLIAGHHVSATRVYLSCDASSTTRFWVRNAYDQRGQPIAWVPWYQRLTGGSYTPDEYEYDAVWVGGGGTYHPKVNPDTDGSVTYALGDHLVYPTFISQDLSVWVTWDDDIGSGGGLTWRGETLRNAADVLEWAASQTGLPVDTAAFRAARAQLAGFLVDAVIEERVSPWEWVKSNLLPWLPVSLAVGSGGVYPVVMRTDARPEHATLRIDADTDLAVSRSGTIHEDTSNIANNITVNYARSIKDGVYRAKVTVGPGPYDSATPTTHVSAYCRESASRYRYANGQPMIVDVSIDIAATCDDATALSVGHSVARARALAKRTVSYTLPVAGYGPRVALGVVAIVTEAAVDLDEAVGLVEDVSWSQDGRDVVVTIWLLPDSSAWGAT